MRPLITLILCAGSACGTSWISSVTPGTPRSDFTGWVGTTALNGATPRPITGLGRYCVSGNALSHTIVIFNHDTGVLLATATVSMAACTPGTFVFGATTGTMAASTSYDILSSELSAGDSWLNDDSVIATTAVATATQSSFSSDVPPIVPTSSTSSTVGVHSFGPVSFQYSTFVPNPTILTVGP